MIASFERALGESPCRALGLVGLAEAVGNAGRNVRSLEIARKALALAPDDPEIEVRVRHLMSHLVASYHVQIMNDPRRNAGWDRALRRAIRPGAQVLELGTGGGLMAMMAARAGAERVTTCEADPILAEAARAVIAHNGYADRIHVAAKRSQDLIVGEDLERPADLLFCDLFAEDLLGLDPLPSIRDARMRLVRPGAPILPATAGIRVALAEWGNYARAIHMGHASGFDLSPFAPFARAAVNLATNDPSLAVLSPDAEIIHFDYARIEPPFEGRGHTVLAADRACTVNGILQWIRMDLDDSTAIGTWPDPVAPHYFMAACLWPLKRPATLRPGEGLRVGAAHNGLHLVIWADDVA